MCALLHLRFGILAYRFIYHDRSYVCHPSCCSWLNTQWMVHCSMKAPSQRRNHEINATAYRVADKVVMSSRSRLPFGCSSETSTCFHVDSSMHPFSIRFVLFRPSGELEPGPIWFWAGGGLQPKTRGQSIAVNTWLTIRTDVDTWMTMNPTCQSRTVQLGYFGQAWLARDFLNSTQLYF